jgi:hypothetical protein
VVETGTLSDCDVTGLAVAGAVGLFAETPGNDDPPPPPPPQAAKATPAIAKTAKNRTSVLRVEGISAIVSARGR